MTTYIFIFFFILSFQTIAQEKNNIDSTVSKLAIRGVYSGENIYVQNPFADDTYKLYCTDSVAVNSKPCIIDLNQSAYKINLDSVVKIKGTDVIIIIYHKKTCKPKVLLPMAFPPPRSKVEFTSFEMDTTGHLHITTRNEPTGNRPPFQIEELRGNMWRTILTIPQKWEVENTYDTIVPLRAGINTFRLSEMLYEKSGGLIIVESSIPDITCILDSEMNCILCSDTAYFEIQTSSKLKLTSGYEKKIDISEFNNGSYILLYENQRLVFDIKRSKRKNK